MAEALDLATSILDVLQLAGTIVTTCIEYQQKVKSASKEALKIQQHVQNLLVVLSDIQGLETEGPNSGLDLSSLTKSDGPLASCMAELKGLQKRLEPKEGWRGKLDALKWPLNEGEMEKTLDQLEHFKTTIQLSLSAAHTKLTKDTNERVMNLQETFREMGLDEHFQKILTWLAAPDASTNYNDARRKHQPGTCAWFTQGDEFRRWISQLRSLLWVNGLPGSGKTILSSEVIRYLLLLVSNQPNSALGYFYCDFKNDQKRLVGSLLRSLISQLWAASSRITQSLEYLYSQCQNGHRQPSTSELTSALKDILSSFEHVYIVIDALDESTEREQLMVLLGEISGWKLGQVHILATSRKEQDIEESLGGAWPTVDMHDVLVNKDIQLHIDKVLQQDKKLCKLPRDIIEEIRDALLRGANGMFRWVACQLDVLRDQGSLKALRDALKSLPSTLDETYERILANISQQRRPIALRILEWVAFSAQPVSLAEINEAIAVELGGEPHFDPNGRLFDPQDLLSYCPSLVIISSSVVIYDYKRRWIVAENGRDGKPGDRVISLAHFTVKEYLVSDRICQSKASFYSLDRQSVNASICRVCLVYLMQFKEVQSDIPPHLPLTGYAAEFWTHHVKSCSSAKDEDLEELIVRFLQPSSAHYQSWPKFHDMNNRWDARADAEILSPLYRMALTGTEWACRLLLKESAEIKRKGGKYGSELDVALQAAVYNEHKDIVGLFLDHGADANVQKGLPYSNSLQEAVRQGDQGTVGLLLEHGADANLTADGCRDRKTSLYLAVSAEHHEIVRLLLEHHADANAQERSRGNTVLQEAVSIGNHGIVGLLLDHGADANLTAGYDMNPLYEAVRGRHHEIVRLLLEHHADANIRGRTNALCEAIRRRDQGIVGLLLDHGADANLTWGYDDSPLYLAVSTDQLEIVRLLLDHRADTNIQGRMNALCEAVYRRNTEIFKLLLDSGADVNVQGQNGSALQDAARSGSEEIMQLLLNSCSGADVNIREYALQVAASAGKRGIVKLLLDNGIDVNAQGEEFGSALQAAAASGHLDVVKLVLDSHAVVNAQGGHYGSALQAAAKSREPKVVELLLDSGANVSVQGGAEGSALQVAVCSSCHRVYRKNMVEVVQLLLGRGADVNATGGRYGNALEAAIAQEHEDVIGLLKRRGAIRSFDIFDQYGDDMLALLYPPEVIPQEESVVDENITDASHIQSPNTYETTEPNSSNPLPLSVHLSPHVANMTSDKGNESSPLDVIGPQEECITNADVPSSESYIQPQDLYEKPTTKSQSSSSLSLFVFLIVSLFFGVVSIAIRSY